MVQRIQKARSRGEFEREERLASETIGGKPRNTAREAHVEEQQDYDEENLAMQGGTKETGEVQTIKAGSYEEDYGVGVQGRREAGQVGEKKDPMKEVLRRRERTVGGTAEDREDFPTGTWSKQKSRAKIAKARPARKPATSSTKKKARSSAKTGTRTTNRTKKTGGRRR